MGRPRLLDLFCGAGGASMGYHRAGFDVVGVDINPQPHYPFAFYRADALTFPLDGFDAIHASPPCQAHSSVSAIHGRRHASLIEPTRNRLVGLGVPTVIENVPGAPVRADVILCGTLFGLGVDGLELRRHRLFELDGFTAPQPQCHHRTRAIGVYGHGGRSARHTMATAAEGRAVMQTEWMTRDEFAQAIPPAYTQWLGRYVPAPARSVMP